MGESNVQLKTGYIYLINTYINIYGFVVHLTITYENNICTSFIHVIFMVCEFLRYVCSDNAGQYNKSNLINFRFDIFFFKQFSSFKIKFSTVLLDSPMVLLTPIIVLFDSPTCFFPPIIFMLDSLMVLLTPRLMWD